MNEMIVGRVVIGQSAEGSPKPTPNPIAQELVSRQRDIDEAMALLKRALPACEYSAMKWKDKEGREDRVKLPEDIQAFLKAKGKL